MIDYRLILGDCLEEMRKMEEGGGRRDNHVTTLQR